MASAEDPPKAAQQQPPLPARLRQDEKAQQMPQEKATSSSSRPASRQATAAAASSSSSGLPAGSVGAAAAQAVEPPPPPPQPSAPLPTTGGSASAPSQAQAPGSAFVTRLRGEIALARHEPPAFAVQPSVGTWLSLSPRGGNGGSEEAPGGSEKRAVRPGVRLPAVTFQEGPAELRVKGGGIKPFKLENLPTTGIYVRDIKALCELHCNLPPEQQRLLYKGKVLSDNQRVEELGIPSGAQVFIAKGAASAASSAAAKAAAEEEERRRRAREEEEMAEAEAEWRAERYLLGRSDLSGYLEDLEDAQQLGVLLLGRACLECGVNPGRLRTDGLCTICFREMLLREGDFLREQKREEEASKRAEEEARLEEEIRKKEEAEKRQKEKERTRCKVCNKKTGLTGFLCRCGHYYCATHRHAEDHGCTFDHRAHGRELLAQQNTKLT
eukprot:TRINITY_DN26072_c0_g1_i1.p1 TRINITY_DN26072_c0_g1~~TRINITY_DN26072_c0_g1_i1.p1  ORF type:complete len:474 (+),score=130.55 TRINITY_DN26072_c0_g1_i1:104-1423(+)